MTKYRRIEPGLYRDSDTGVALLRAEGKWVLCIDALSKSAFVTLQWGSPVASKAISGFRTMSEAKDFDFWHLFHRTGKPNINVKGEICSIPVTGLGAVPYCRYFRIDDLKLVQGTLF